MTTVDPHTSAAPRAPIVPGSRPRLAPEEMAALFRSRLQSRLLDTAIAYGQLTVTVAPEAWVTAARLCKVDPELEFDFFDWLSAVDLAEEGFAVVCHLYSVPRIQHVILRTVAPGGREAPRLASITGVYRGANWHERETYDMFGVLFDGHPGLLPRLFTVENFEGFPLRKEFRLATRDAKPWPGAKEPEERKQDEEEAASPTAAQAPVSAEDKAAAAKAKAERAKAKAAAMRAKKAAERAAAQAASGDEAAAAGAAAPAQRDAVAEAAEATGGGDTTDQAAAQAAAAAGEPEPQTPEGAADVAGTDIAKDAAAGAVAGDTARGAPGDVPGVEQPVPHAETEAEYGEGAPETASGSPGVEVEGRHTGAVDQAGDKPAAETPGMDAPRPAGDAARDPDETPAPGPASDVPGQPGPPSEGRPVTPAPGSEAGDETGDPERGPDRDATDQERASSGRETPPPDSPGTDAADRRDDQREP